MRGSTPQSCTFGAKLLLYNEPFLSCYLTNEVAAGTELAPLVPGGSIHNHQLCSRDSSCKGLRSWGLPSPLASGKAEDVCKNPGLRTASGQEPRRTLSEEIQEQVCCPPGCSCRKEKEQERARCTCSLLLPHLFWGLATKLPG